MNDIDAVNSGGDILNCEKQRKDEESLTLTIPFVNMGAKNKEEWKFLPRPQKQAMAALNPPRIVTS